MLSVDFKQKTILYSRIKNYQTIEDHYIKAMIGSADLETTLELQFLAGKGLAAIHKNMSLETTNVWSATSIIKSEMFTITKCTPENFLSGTPRALQHGDYGLGNLGFCYENNSNIPRLIIFDPSPNFYITQKPNEYCSIYVDIGVYFSDLNGRVPAKFYPKINWSHLPLLKANFINAYQTESRIELDTYNAEVMGYCAAAAYFVRRYGNGIRKKMTMNFLYNHLKKNVFWK